MSIDFTTVKSIVIPEGTVSKIIHSDGSILWSGDQSNALVLGSIEIGSSVTLNVNGVSTEFTVVHQGIPDATIYDSSCNGTWLMMKNVYTSDSWDDSSDDYDASSIHEYLNNTFISLLDSDIQDKLKEVKIPYRKYDGETCTVYSGANGLSAKAFLLSCDEVGAGVSGLADGACLKYFEGMTSSNNAKRIAYYNDSAVNWWLRSPYDSPTNFPNFVYMINTSGGRGGFVSSTSYGIRPTIILPANMEV